jgi:nucleotide-binding universal stress UspA family protein
MAPIVRSILIATDGSDTATRAVEHGAELALRIGASVHVVTAYEPLHGASVAGGGPEATAWHIRSDSKAEAVLDAACALLRLRGVDAEPHARNADPADAILDVAEQVGSDLIVVGSRGMTGSKRFLLGSVPDKISHHARCSVMIVHTA